MHALADAGFTGGLTTEDTVAFMVNGRLVGLTGGTTEAFWGAEFTALEADGPALPLLCAMFTSDADTEGEYYTGETPIAEVDETLSQGGFTGYLELSENVFSGDYFVAYYGGRSFAAAFLGTEERLVTGDEARERANDEVGIFTVNSVEIDVIDIPQPDVDDSATTAAPDPTEEPAPEEPSAQEEEIATANPAAEPTPEPIREPASGGGSQTARQQERSELAQLAESALGADPGTVGRGAQRTQPAEDEWLAIPALDPDRTGGLERPQETTRREPTTAQDPVSEPEAPDEPETAQSERQEALEETRAENERLRERIEELEAQVAEFEAEAAAQAASMNAVEALDGTNLFVRYETQSNFTLADAIEGSADRSDLANNLRLEWHTAFETDETTVEGEPFESFLKGTVSYRFSDWLLQDLLFELVDRDEASGFGDLLEVLPDIDRIEFRGDVPIHRRDAGERDAQTFTFDLVFRNSMGDPVMLAEVHEGRDPVQGEALDRLLADMSDIASERQQVAGAFYVTQSYFEPPALETVVDATGGGFLRGGSRTSYVSISRKRGFHLCLVEARDDSFHLNVPDD